LNNQFNNKQFPLGNPLANVLVVIVGALVMGVSLVLGVVAFVALAGLVLVLAAIIGIRIWWFKRKLGKQYSASGNAQAVRPEHIQIIEGEYRDVSRPDEDKSEPKS
jgi:uncharacterized membrane protein YphA (DoxX/SURF4 family)